LKAYAASNIYQCLIVSDAYIKADGSLDLIQDSPRIGEKFTVLKKTGEIFEHVTGTLKNPRVAALGSEKNAYKVIWEQKAAGKNGAFIDYLSIDESIRGKMKPFGLFSGSMLLTGICE